VVGSITFISGSTEHYMNEKHSTKFAWWRIMESWLMDVDSYNFWIPNFTRCGNI